MKEVESIVILRIILYMISAISLFAPVFATDSLMTIQEYRTKTYQIINVATTGNDILDSTILVSFVKDAVIRVYTDIGLPKSKIMSITANTASYLVDDALIWIKGITLDTNEFFSSLREIDVSRLSEASYYNDLSGQSSRTRFYIRHGDSIRLYPPPTEDDSMYVFYFARGAFPAVVDTISISSECRMAILYATAEMCNIRRGMYNDADYFAKKYNEEVVRVRRKFEVEGKNE